MSFKVLKIFKNLIFYIFLFKIDQILRLCKKINGKYLYSASKYCESCRNYTFLGNYTFRADCTWTEWPFSASTINIGEANQGF